MFERYTEKARRAIFFARYEASQFGSEYIKPDFVLLGILRENPGVGQRWLGANYAELRERVAQLYPTPKRLATSVDLPLSNEAKRALAHAAEEAEQLGHRYIGTEHLFLGLLGESDCVAAEMFKARGGDLNAVRAAISKEPEQSEARPSIPSFSGVNVTLVEGGNNVAAIPWHARVPNVGESVSLSDSQGAETTYRIRDIKWQIKAAKASVLRVAEVLIEVQKEKL